MCVCMTPAGVSASVSESMSESSVVVGGACGELGRGRTAALALLGLGCAAESLVDTSSRESMLYGPSCVGCKSVFVSSSAARVMARSRSRRLAAGSQPRASMHRCFRWFMDSSVSALELWHAVQRGEPTSPCSFRLELTGSMPHIRLQLEAREAADPEYPMAVRVRRWSMSSK